MEQGSEAGDGAGVSERVAPDSASSAGGLLAVSAGLPQVVETAQAPTPFPSWAPWPGASADWAPVHCWVSSTRVRCGKISNALDVSTLRSGRHGKTCWQCEKGLKVDRETNELEQHALQQLSPHGRRISLGRSISQLVRDVGDELLKVSPQESISRLQAAVRGLYEQAKRGNANSAKLLFDRGWGPLPEVKVDLGKELLDAMEEQGLSYADVASDPLAVELFRLAGVDVDRLGQATLGGSLTLQGKGPGPSENPEAATDQLHQADVSGLSS